MTQRVNYAEQSPAEIARGFWFVGPADAYVVFRTPTEGLWEELVQRSRGLAARL
jgi:putative AlgH/UPF0301 family transcriptional regulator